MRFGIISDIHANLPALEAVIEDMKKFHIDHIICLGDVIGYGPSPSECLKRVREVTEYVIMGNHEAAVVGFFDVDCFHDEAKEHIVWTGKQLSKEEIEYVKGLHYMLDFETFMISHGAFIDPEDFSYIETEEEAIEAFDTNPLKLMFIGHTHVPIVHSINKLNEYSAIDKDDIKLDPESRYIVNPGAVGLARDKDLTAGYAIFDSKENHILMRRINYSITALYDAIKSIARSPEHHKVLLERFKPRNVIKIGEMKNISKSDLKDAVARHRKQYG